MSNCITHVVFAVGTLMVFLTGCATPTPHEVGQTSGGEQPSISSGAAGKKKDSAEKQLHISSEHAGMGISVHGDGVDKEDIESLLQSINRQLNLRPSAVFPGSTLDVSKFKCTCQITIHATAGNTATELESVTTTGECQLIDAKTGQIRKRFDVEVSNNPRSARFMGTVKGFIDEQIRTLGARIVNQLELAAKELPRIAVNESPSDLGSKPQSPLRSDEKGSSTNTMPNPVVRLELLVSSGKGERGRVTGSGFVVSEDGYLVTNDHVVHPAVGGHAWNVNSLLVKLDPDGPKERALRGKVVAFDSAADVAVVKIDPPKQLPVLRIVGSPEPKAGDRVIARGYPLGGKFTVTKGEVLRVHEPTGKCPTKIVVCNARVEQGNSGGPLVNQTGEVVGVAVAKAIIRIDRPDADRLRAMAEVQDAAAQALRQMSEAAAKAGMKLKAEGDKGGYGAQLSELASQGKKAVEEYEIRRPGILELAYGSAQFTFAIAIEDVRRLLQKWNVPVKE